MPHERWEPYYRRHDCDQTYDPKQANNFLAAAGQTNLKTAPGAGERVPVRGRNQRHSGSQLAGRWRDARRAADEFPRWLQTVFLNAQDYDLTLSSNHVEAAISALWQSQVLLAL